jgi:ethanolamine ammonia-lyase small subunit
VAQGRTGTRYLTRAYIQLRAEHAIALDAVRSTVPDDFAATHGCLALASRARDHEEYLLYPGQGRRLSDASRDLLQREGTRGADVQVIAGDGLSAWALLANAPDLLPALVSGLTGAGFTVGRPLFVRHARVGVQDEIGVLLGARATAILVGERPGLGTGDSLSIYTAFRPRLDQDNAEKDCLSNIRPLGMPPLEAARECVDLLRRTFRAGGGGVHLTRSGT